MLVLTRKHGDAVKIQIPPSVLHQEVEIFIVGVARQKVKIGFKAPRTISVVRSEKSAAAEPGAVE